MPVGMSLIFLVDVKVETSARLDFSGKKEVSPV